MPAGVGDGRPPAGGGGNRARIPSTRRRAGAARLAHNQEAGSANLPAATIAQRKAWPVPRRHQPGNRRCLAAAPPGRVFHRLGGGDATTPGGGQQKLWLPAERGETGLIPGRVLRRSDRPTIGYRALLGHADMAEQADALRSGRSEGNLVRVQLSLSAPTQVRRNGRRTWLRTRRARERSWRFDPSDLHHLRIWRNRQTHQVEGLAAVFNRP
jgi:hypothetical protein